MSNTRVRVISYNILSSHLASPDHFIACKPEHLSNRLPKILTKLKQEIQTNKPIICLQEVSQSWCGPLHSFFSNHKYHFVSGLYGKKFNGYMGVGLAYSYEKYDTVQVDLGRLSDSRDWPRKEEEEESFLSSSVSLFRSLFNLQPPPKDDWNYAERRMNMLVFAKLKDVETKSVFGIANYHMPCAYYAPMVMTLHSAMAVTQARTLSENCPFILAGDFNILPGSPQYKMITSGTLDSEDYPTPKYGMEFTLPSTLRSSYACSDHGEPDFTNYAQIKDKPEFIETLDYIFISEEWKVVQVKKTPHRSDVTNGPFPNEDEPSDHILISSDLEL